jgi:hypothetical protein
MSSCRPSTSSGPVRVWLPTAIRLPARPECLSAGPLPERLQQGALRPGPFRQSVEVDIGDASGNVREVTQVLPEDHLPFDPHAVNAGSRSSNRSRRVSRDGEPAELAAPYRPTGSESPPPRGSLAHWLTERYCLYTLDGHGDVLRADIHHPPWPLRTAKAEFELNTMAEPYGLELGDAPPVLLHFSRRQDVLIWPLGPVGRAGTAR